MPKRRKLAIGIYEDAYGRSVIYHAHGAPVETRFEKDRPLDFLIRWRKRKIGQADELAPRDRRGSLARDAVTFLKTRKGRPNYKTEKSNLRAWIAALNNPSRWAITRQHLEETVATWRAKGYAQQTLRHRCRILRQLFQTLDGKRAPSPFDEFTMPAKPRPRPISVSEDTIKTVAIQLLHQEMTHRLHTAKTRARFLILATHSQRPAELKRAQRIDLDLDRRVWAVRGAKGSYNTIVPLNEEQLAAWRLFVGAAAWGTYDTRSFSKTLQRNGWPKGIRVYNLRHSTGIALSERDVELGDIQGLYGHTSPETSRIYVPGQLNRLRKANERLVGRFGLKIFQPPLPRTTTTIAPGRMAKGRGLMRNSESALQERARRAIGQKP